MIKTTENEQCYVFANPRSQFLSVNMLTDNILLTLFFVSGELCVT